MRRAAAAPTSTATRMLAALTMPTNIDDDARVATTHSYTGRMCAASRWIEGRRPDSLFTDPLGYKLAGAEGRKSPMGDWIMTPRTRFADDLVREHYEGSGGPAAQPEGHDQQDFSLDLYVRVQRE